MQRTNRLILLMAIILNLSFKASRLLHAGAFHNSGFVVVLFCADRTAGILCYRVNEVFGGANGEVPEAVGIDIKEVNALRAGQKAAACAGEEV